MMGVNTRFQTRKCSRQGEETTISVNLSQSWGVMLENAKRKSLIDVDDEGSDETENFPKQTVKELTYHHWCIKPQLLELPYSHAVTI
jgi:hypothetical protein